MSFDNDSNPSNGVMNCPGGRSVELYKNWAYIHDKKAWHKGTGFTAPIVAQIILGKGRVSGINVCAKRGPQESLFLFAEHAEYPKRVKSGVPSVTIYTRMAGVAGYGWESGLPKLMKAAGKRKLPKGAMVFAGTSDNGKGKCYEVVDLAIPGKNGKKDRFIREWIKLPQRPELEAQFVGITPETAKKFFKWLKTVAKEHSAEDWFKKIDQKTALHFNQGDAFFAKAMKQSTPASPVGKANEPILTKMFKKTFAPKKGKK
jgi:hypothetical protein